MNEILKIETRSAEPIETRDEGGDDLATAAQAVGELRTAVDQHRSAVDARLTTELRSLNERLDAIDVRTQRPGGTEKTVEEAEDARAFGVYLRRGEAALTDTEKRALTVGNDASAGYLAPEQFGREIVKTLAEYSPIRNYARVVTISGSEIKYPKRLSGTNAQWVSEIGDRPESSVTYGQLTLTPYELATFVEVSKQLLEDAAYDVEGEIRDTFAEDVGVKEGAAFITGDGVGKPKGILAAGTGIQEIVSGNASTLGANPGDLLIDMMARIPTAHANNGAWLMNRLSLAAVRKLKDAQGAYLWQPSLRDGAPSTLLGRPVIEAVEAPNIAAGAFPIVFGDWSGYRIVDKLGLSVLVDPFTRAKNGITVFHMRKRVGGAVTHPDRFVKLKIAAA